jgi:hypothetical protein
LITLKGLLPIPAQPLSFTLPLHKSLLLLLLLLLLPNATLEPQRTHEALSGSSPEPTSHCDRALQLCRLQNLQLPLHPSFLMLLLQLLLPHLGVPKPSPPPPQKPKMAITLPLTSDSDRAPPAAPPAAAAAVPATIPAAAAVPSTGGEVGLLPPFFSLSTYMHCMR